MELGRLKPLLGIALEDETKDAALAFAMENVEEIIRNYCHTETVPEGLLNTAYRMTIDLWRNENLGEEAPAQGSVSSISEGDTSVSFKQTVDDGFRETVLKNYKPVLNRYRRLVF